MILSLSTNEPFYAEQVELAAFITTQTHLHSERSRPCSSFLVAMLSSNNPPKKIHLIGTLGDKAALFF